MVQRNCFLTAMHNMLWICQASIMGPLVAAGAHKFAANSSLSPLQATLLVEVHHMRLQAAAS